MVKKTLRVFKKKRFRKRRRRMMMRPRFPRYDNMMNITMDFSSPMLIVSPIPVNLDDP